jgi:glutathione synthase/RimK-type ligase-like ATP-grasp enzyme
VTPRYVVVCNPDTPRGRAYPAELRDFWAARGVTPEVVVVPWADLVPGDGCLDGLPAVDRPAVVKLESPGKSDAVYRLLLDAGSRETPGEPRRSWADLDLPKGLLVRPGLHFAGFRRVLRGLKSSFAARPHLTPTADPDAVALMFDKTAAAERLRGVGVPVPQTLEQRFEAWPQRVPFYVKLNAGSSAVGIAVATRDNHLLKITTTVLHRGGAFFNSRRLQEYAGSDAMAVLNWIVAEGAIVQEGVPAARIGGRKFDVRVVCYYGRPVASIFRLSDGPITNLHLGGTRGDFETCKATIPPRDWLDGLDHASDAAEAFDSAVCGVDLIFEPGHRTHAVLEVNAFGDFFPGLTTSEGLPLRFREIAETVRRANPPAANRRDRR